jgi:hypothetical protein
MQIVRADNLSLQLRPCPSVRITGLLLKDILVKEIGTLKYPGARPFVRYAIEEMAPRYIHINQEDGSILEVRMR